MVMKPGHKFFRIREQFFVPCVACPSASVFRININQMPVHINHRYGKRNFFFLESCHQCFIFLIIVTVKSAPPISKCIPWKQRCLSSEMIVVFQTMLIFMSIPQEININTIFLSRLYPSIFCYYK